MKLKSVLLAVTMLGAGHVLAVAQQDEVKLEAAQAKITTVSAMRVRRAPQVSAQEISRLKVGTVVNAIARSANQDSIGGKTDYWYRVKLPNGTTGWLFGGLLLDYNAGQRNELIRQIIEARLKAENTDFSDRQEIYNLASSSVNEAKDVNTRAEFELLKLLALANQAMTFPDDQNNKSPYREWLKTHSAKVIRNEFAGGYNLRSDMLWDLEKKYHSLPIADRIAWEAAQNPIPSDCESDEVCGFFRNEGEIKYLILYPNGAHAAEALTSVTDALTEEVIKVANDQSNSDQYIVEYRTQLRKIFASLRTTLAKTSAPEKTELLKKLERVSKR
ncbi:MAG TPA: SH3 domain-containing protein [Pyrinomonadaceae bacterium]